MEPDPRAQPGEAGSEPAGQQDGESSSSMVDADGAITAG